MGRIIIFTGKGGVGKTLLVSTDMAHNLSDLFGQKLGRVPTEVYPDLDTLELDPAFILEEEFQEFKIAFVNLLSSPGISFDGFDELSGFPGMDELISLLKIMEIYESDVYGRIIVDCAPTSETLSLLKFPEMLSWYMEKFFPLGKTAMRILSPVAKAALKVELPNRKAMSDIERLFQELDCLQQIMKNRDIFSVRFVTTPEKIVIQEARKNFTCLHLFKINVDAIIVNKVYPSEALEGYFHKWVTLQEEGLMDIEESFRDIPVLRLELKPYELKSIPVLLESCTFYNEKNPADVFCQAKVFEICKVNSETFLRIHLPHAEKDEMALPNTVISCRLQ